MLFLILFLLHPAQGQSPARTCPLLTQGEAAAVLGPSARLTNSGPGCEYTVGKLRLNVIQPVRIPDERIRRNAFQTMQDDKQGIPEPGIGDRAFHAAGKNGLLLAAIEGETLFGLELKGEGTDSSLLPKLRKAIRQVIGHATPQ